MQYENSDTVIPKMVKHIHSQDDQQQSRLVRHVVKVIRKNGLKQFQRNREMLRKLTIRNDAIVQISKEQHLHSLIREWRQIVALNFKKDIMVSLLVKEQKCNWIRRAFHRWRVDHNNWHKAELHRHRKLYSSFLVTCSGQLSLRLKRIQLTSRRIRHLFIEFVRVLNRQHQKAGLSVAKAEEYRNTQELQTKSRVFDQLLRNRTQRHLEEQKQQLAVLFFRRASCRKAIRTLFNEKSGQFKSSNRIIEFVSSPGSGCCRFVENNHLAQKHANLD